MHAKPMKMEPLSVAELQRHAEETAQAMLKVSYEQALKMLDSGKLSGTLAETELRAFRHMIGTESSACADSG